MEFTSFLAHFLSVLNALTICALLAMGLKFLLFVPLGMIVGREKLMTNLMAYMPPLDFIASLAHGFLAIWLGSNILYWLQTPIDFFLGVPIAGAFLWIDIPKIRQTDGSLLEQFGIREGEELPPDLANNPMIQMLQNMPSDSPQLQQLRRTMRNNRIIILIGKITGVILAMTNIVFWK